MGLNDTAEQLAVCREVNVANEQRIAELQAAYDLQRRRADEAEHDAVQAESALAERLRQDAHGVAAIEADLRSARTRLAALARLVHPLAAGDDEPLTVGIIRRILDETTAEPWGAYLDLDEAHVAERACRHSAASIRSVLELGPERIDAAVSTWLPALDRVADRLRTAP